MTARETRPVHTYSIVARDPQTGELGVAVQSHAFSVGSVVTWAEAGVGAVATQSLVRVDYGPLGIARMRDGQSAAAALAALVAADDNSSIRQVAMVDAHGTVAAHTGERCIAAAGHITGDGFSVQANMMLNDTVWPAMHDAWLASTGELADRLLAALEAAQAAGGDIRGEQSAAMLVVTGTRAEHPWEGRRYDLRVDDHPHPLRELGRLMRLQRAYELADQAEALSANGEFDAATAVLGTAMGLAPGLLELQFWAAVARFRAGDEAGALRIFAEVFAREPIWADLVPRLVTPGMLPDDPQAIARITEVLTR